MQDFKNLIYTVSEEHKDLRDERLRCDTADLDMTSLKITMCSPFSQESPLRSFVTGIVHAVA